MEMNANEKPSYRFRAVAVALWSLLLAATFAAPRFIELAGAGDFLVRNTARIFVGFWAAAVVLILRGDPSARLVWTLAWAAFVVHVMTAFAYTHGWSHSRAFEHVEQASGFGPGIFVSYFFTLAWTADVLWWWLAPRSRAGRPSWLSAAWQGFMAFIVFNGTVVYESGPIRWIGGAVLLGLSVMFCRSRIAERVRES